MAEMSVAMMEVANLAARLGVRDIYLMDGCWEHAVDEQWWIAVNGHDEPVACSHGMRVPPFACYVECNDFPAGIIDPFGGTLPAGEAANEDTFIAALRAAPAQKE